MSTVKLTDLVPDACNFADRTFERFVSRFMADYMPGLPMDLLNTDNPEEWEVTPDQRFKITSPGVWVCVECGTEWDEPTVCCKDDEDNAVRCEEAAQRYIIVDTNTDERFAEAQNYSPWADGVMPDDVTDYWTEEHEAEDVARQLDHERFEPHGYPWANNWAYMPDDRITDEQLQAAGFTVATYREHRLAGIDGGGYSFSGQHFAALCAIVHAAYGWPVDTDNGPRLITA